MEHGPTGTLTLGSGLQICERIHFYCFKPPCLSLCNNSPRKLIYQPRVLVNSFVCMPCFPQCDTNLLESKVLILCSSYLSPDPKHLAHCYSRNQAPQCNMQRSGVQSEDCGTGGEWVRKTCWMLIAKWMEPLECICPKANCWIFYFIIVF